MSDKILKTNARVSAPAIAPVAPEFLKFEIASKQRLRLVRVAIRILLCAFLGASMSSVAADQITFDPSQDGSLASKTIRVPRPGNWDVQMRLSNTARELRKQFAESVLQTSAPAGSASAQPATVHVHLLLTVTGVYGKALRVIQEFEVYEEPSNKTLKQGDTGKACFEVKQLPFNKGTYTVALRVMEADPELEGFESSLLVESSHK